MYKWKPIEDLTQDQTRGHPKLDALLHIWKEQAAKLKESESQKQFQDKLNREWAIETGIIENLYSLDRGTTRTLIEHGIKASFIAHDGCDKPPEWVASILRDQQNALEFVFDFIGDNRPLSTSYIKELHHLLTMHQEYTDGVDSMGRKVLVPIVHGDWKKLPNNPTRTDGTIHEYCPPEHVASEMDRLIALHAEHLDRGVSPEVEAAWLHHRFTQIHPFQDGNGRMARCLSSLVFIKAGGFPLVVNNDHKNEYIDALEKADAGDIHTLVKMFADIELRWFLKALSISESLLGGPVVSRRKILEVASQKLTNRLNAVRSERNKVVDIAKKIHHHTDFRLRELKKEIDEILGNVPDLSCRIQNSKPGDSHWFHYQIGEIANFLEYYADLQTLGEWCRLQIRNGQQTDIVISIHSIGTDFVGVAGVSAYLQVKSQAEENTMSANPPIPLCKDLFQITYLDTWETLMPQYDEWLDGVLAVALDQWQKGL